MPRVLGPTVVISLGMAFITGTIAHASVVVRYEPEFSTVGLGDTFTLDIVADLPDAILAWGVDFTVSDGSVLSTWPDNALLSSPVIGPQWVDPGSTPDGDLLGGVAFPNSISGTGIILATVTFSADTLGATDLFLSDDNPFPHESPPNDLTEGFGLDPTGFADVTYLSGHVLVTPEPSSVLLVISGMLVVHRRRRPAR